MNLLVTDFSKNYLVNDLTREMDTYVKHPCETFNTYIEPTPIVLDEVIKYAIRYPGATRGEIILDENSIIKKIHLFKDYSNTHTMYSSEVEKCFEKYIGMRFYIYK